MCSLDIVRMIVSPRSSHTLGIPMVRNDVAIVRELFVADSTFPVLLDDLAVQQFPHLRRRAEFSVSSPVMRIFDPRHPGPDQPGPGHDFPAAAGKRFVDWAEFIATKPHDILLVKLVKSAVGWSRLSGNLLPQVGCYNFCPRETMSNLTNVVQQLKKERDQAQRRVEQLDEALKALGSLGGLQGRVGRAQTAGKPRRTMSVAARKRIAAAQRARWAKWKVSRRNK